MKYACSTKYAAIDGESAARRVDAVIAGRNAQRRRRRATTKRVVSHRAIRPNRESGGVATTKSKVCIEKTAFDFRGISVIYNIPSVLF
jgi:hypothetical protein